MHFSLILTLAVSLALPASAAPPTTSPQVPVERSLTLFKSLEVGVGKKIFPRVQLRLYKEKEEVLEYTVVDGWQRPTARDDSESIPALAVTRRDGAEILEEVLRSENYGDLIERGVDRSENYWVIVEEKSSLA